VYPRVVAVVGLDGVFDTTTAILDPTLSNWRGAATDNGTNIWVAGNPGVRYIAGEGSGNSTAITSSASMRTATIFNHPLDGPALWIAGSTSGSVSLVGNLGADTSAGLTLAGQLTLPASPAAASLNSLWFSDENTLWATDDTLGLINYVATYDSPQNIDMLYAQWTVAAGFPLKAPGFSSVGFKASTGRWEFENIVLYLTTSVATGNSLLRWFQPTGAWTELYTTAAAGQLRAVFAFPLPISPSSTSTATPSATPSISLSSSITLTSSATATSSASASQTPSRTRSITPSGTVGASSTGTATGTPTPTNTATSSGTPTSTGTASPSGTTSPSGTPSPTATGTRNSFFPDSMVVMRVGNGDALGAANPTFLDEFDPTTGALRRTIALPASATSSGGACFCSSGASEGVLGRSNDGRVLLVPCFSDITDSPPSYTMGLVTADLNVDTSTVFTDAGNYVRSAASLDGSVIYYATSTNV
jgi:hypothetical protein